MKTEQESAGTKSSAADDLKTKRPRPDDGGGLTLSFDVGHSSIGWAVLGPVQPDIRGCGVVTFPPDDCLASERRQKRQQRRHIRATRRRIENLEALLGAMNLSGLDRAKLDKLHAQGKGKQREERESRDGFSNPWLLAARLLMAKRSGRDPKDYLLTWPELWDVLRWYAHNRGYDENRRWSGGFQAYGMSPEPLENVAAHIEQAADKMVALTDAAEGVEQNAEDEESESEKTEDSAAKEAKENSEKLKGAARLMKNESTLTFAETVAKVLLGPPRVVTPPKQPGQTGRIAKAEESFTQEDFKRLLFDLAPEFRDHPRHLQNYFKGLRYSFPRRVLGNNQDTGDEQKPWLVSGVEWEVRYILAQHLNAPNGKACVTEDFIRCVCGGLPEADVSKKEASDWRCMSAALPSLYQLSATDGQRLDEIRERSRQLKISKGDPIDGVERKVAQQRELAAERRNIVRRYLRLPARYRGGLLFGQLVPRFDNRIIRTCPVAYSRIMEALRHADDDPASWVDELAWSKRDKDWLLEAVNTFKSNVKRDSNAAAKKRQAAKPREEIARRTAEALAKVPGKHGIEFLDFRWAMLLRNLRVRKPSDAGRLTSEGCFKNGESLRPLTVQERSWLNEQMQQRGFLRYDGKNANDLADLIRKPSDDGTWEPVVNWTSKERVGKEDKTIIHHADNLDALLIPPDMQEALMLLPLSTGVESRAAFQYVWRCFDAPLRRAFRSKLLRGKKDEPKELSISSVIAKLREMLKSDKPDHRQRKEVLEQIIHNIEAGLDAPHGLSSRVKSKTMRDLLEKKFSCPRLKGRAPYHRHVLRQVVEEIMRGEDPTRTVEQDNDNSLPLPAGKTQDGCLVATVLQAALPAKASGDQQRRYSLISRYRDDLRARPLASDTNNHLVRHRLGILCGNPNDPKHPSLLRDIRRRFPGKISRVVIEVTRDLQTMSGLSNKQKSELERLKLQQHEDANEELLKKLGDSDLGRIPRAVMRKARILYDHNWECPYTKASNHSSGCLCPSWLMDNRRSDPHYLDRDHIIPRSKRLSDALEAQVITFKVVNQLKGSKTAAQFMRQFHGGEPVPGLTDRVFKSWKEYQEWVESLPAKRCAQLPHNDDIRRAQKRKKLLLLENYEDKEFTPRDLTNTSHIIKMAAMQMTRIFELEQKEGIIQAVPPVVCIPGSVTACFRDRAWKLLDELRAFHNKVQDLQPQGTTFYRLRFKSADAGTEDERRKSEKQNTKKIHDHVKAKFSDEQKKSFKELERVGRTDREDAERERLRLTELLPEDLRPFTRLGKATYNLKKEIRAVTDLHHAVDAIALALVTEMLVPEGHMSLNGTLAKLIVKGNLNNAEKAEFTQTANALNVSLADIAWCPKERMMLAGRTDEERAESEAMFAAKASNALKELRETDKDRGLTHEQKDQVKRLLEAEGLADVVRFGMRHRLGIRKLSHPMKKAVQQALKEAADHSIIQHVPSDMSGLSVKETIRRIVRSVSPDVATDDGFLTRVRMQVCDRCIKTPTSTINAAAHDAEIKELSERIKMLGSRPTGHDRIQKAALTEEKNRLIKLKNNLEAEAKNEQADQKAQAQQWMMDLRRKLEILHNLSKTFHEGGGRKGMMEELARINANPWTIHWPGTWLLAVNWKWIAKGGGRKREMEAEWFEDRQIFGLREGGKLAAQQGVMKRDGNWGVAFLNQRSDLKPQERFILLSRANTWLERRKLKRQHGSRNITWVQQGAMIRISRGAAQGVWRVCGAGVKKPDRFYLDAATPDAPKRGLEITANQLVDESGATFELLPKTFAP